jgi:hypothetical protein
MHTVQEKVPRNPRDATGVGDANVPGLLAQVITRLAGVEEGVSALKARLKPQSMRREWFSAGEVARLLHKAPYTVRQWCVHGRLRAKKLANSRQWRVHRSEVVRYRAEGLRAVAD